MDTSDLYALSPLDGRYHGKLSALRTITSEYGLIYYRSLVEVRWLQHLSGLSELPACPTLPTTGQTLLEQFLHQFDTTDACAIKNIEQTTQHDVKAIEYHLQDFLKKHPSLTLYQPWVHFACTSEDINNVAYSLMLKDALTVHRDALQSLTEDMKHLAQDTAGMSMLARTHGQAATPTTLGKELYNFIYRLEREQQRSQSIDILAKFNGASGNYNAHCIACPHIDWPSVNQSFIESLGLTFNPYTTQIEPHDALAEHLDSVSRTNTILIDLNRDMWSYISLHYFTQKTKDGEVGSSTMPHKVNPIDFENAEGNLGIANALAQHMARKLPISRWQRDLSDSTVLRNLGVVFGHSLLAYQSTQKGFCKCIPHADTLKKDLDNHWEILTEAIQTVMRYHQVPDAYERLKAFSRGKTIHQKDIEAFIQSLPIPDNEKTRLRTLTPSRYAGLASQLTHEALA